MAHYFFGLTDQFSFPVLSCPKVSSVNDPGNHGDEISASVLPDYSTPKTDYWTQKRGGPILKKNVRLFNYRQ